MLRLALVVVALSTGAAFAAPPTGAIKGTVIFEGEAPDRPVVKRDSDPYCDKGEHRGEDGAFELRGLPPGTYTVEAWHPVLGTRTLTVKVGVGPKGTVPARFSFKAP